MSQKGKYHLRTIRDGKLGQQWRELRRQYILEDIIPSKPDEYWTARKIAVAAREHPEISRAQPNYSTMTAHRDWAIIKEELKEKREELATQYIDQQLEQIDDLLEDLFNQYDELNAINLSDIIKPAQRIATQLRIASEKNKIIAAIDKLFSRQQSLLPMAVPKEVRIDQRSVSMNMDKLLEMRAKALELPQGSGAEVIEGEIIHSSNGNTH